MTLRWPSFFAAATSFLSGVPSAVNASALPADTAGSDGGRSRAELVGHYEEAGFDGLAITDHWIRTEAESTERLLVIPSSELSCRLADEPDGHVLALGIDEDPLEFVRTRP